MTPRPEKTQPALDAAGEQRSASRTSFLLGTLALLDTFMLLGLAAVVTVLRGQVPPELIAAYGSFKLLLFLFLILLISAVGAWVSVRNRDASSRAIAVVSGIAHLAFIPLGTLLAAALFFFLPPKQWLWQRTHKAASRVQAASPA